MIETKSITVHPNNENAQIELWSKFGWQLKSSQEIYSKDSHLERRGDKIYNVTQTTNYVKLVFQRDTEMKNYDELKKLESEYDLIFDPPIRSFKSSIIALAVGIIIAIYGISESVIPPIIIGIIVSFVSVFLIVRTNKNNKETRDKIIKNNEKRREILSKCEALL